ncbi:MAG: hypothetical protein ACJ796_05020 [Gemmatimonadaceae bacterium]
MRCHGAATAFVMTAVLTLLACGVQGNGRQSVRDTAARSAATSVVDAGKSLSSTGDLPVTLPVSESTPVGVRIDSVTIWLDSTRIGAAVKALGPKAALRRYDPWEKLFVACYRIADRGVAYVLLKAGYADTGRVVQAVITRDQDNMEPDLRCASLRQPSLRVSNSLGLKLGMRRTEVERLLGTSGDTTRGVDKYYTEYTLGQIAKDASAAGAERALHAEVVTNLVYQRDTLIKIRIRRGKPVPRFVE